LAAAVLFVIKKFKRKLALQTEKLKEVKNVNYLDVEFCLYQFNPITFIHYTNTDANL
jgi:hypothetical protein